MSEPLGAVISLDALPRAASATIVGLRKPADALESDVMLRLVEIGFVPGEEVRVIAHGFPGNDPIAVRVGGHATFALRGYEAALIQVEPAKGAA